MSHLCDIALVRGVVRAELEWQTDPVRVTALLRVKAALDEAFDVERTRLRARDEAEGLVVTDDDWMDDAGWMA